MTRRQAVKTTALVTVAIATTPTAIAQFFNNYNLSAFNAGEIPFKLPLLPYPLAALEPHIDAHTMQIHHDEIHANYVKSLNLTFGRDEEGSRFYGNWIIKNRGPNETGVTEEKWLEDTLLKDLNSVPQTIRASVRNNGGGHYNHSLFWQMMKKNGGGEPKGELAETLNKTFGSYGGFKEKLTQAALEQSGDGWAWLTVGSSALKVEATKNEDTPISFGREVLLGIDVWKHAYYLKYQDNRADYIAAWWNLVNWDFVAERYAKLKS